MQSHAYEHTIQQYHVQSYEYDRASPPQNTNIAVYTEFELCRPSSSQSKWLKIDLKCPQDIVFQLYLAKKLTHAACSLTVSLRQLSFLFYVYSTLSGGA